MKSKFSIGQAVMWVVRKGSSQFEQSARVIGFTDKRVRIRTAWHGVDPSETTVDAKSLSEPTPRDLDQIEALIPWA